MKSDKATKDITVEEAQAKGIRFHYVRNRDPKLLRTLKDGSVSRGVPIACIASRINRDKRNIEYGISTVHMNRSKRDESILLSARDFGLDQRDFADLANEVATVCKLRGVKVSYDKLNVKSLTIHKNVKPGDSFSYPAGRRIALGRLKECPITIEYDVEPSGSLEILRLIMLDVAADTETSTRVKHEAMGWLEYKANAVSHSNEKKSATSRVGSSLLTAMETTTTTDTSVRRVPRFDGVNFER